MPEPGLMTIGEVAARIRHLARDPFVLTERLRHWGKLGLLVTADRHSEGTGRHKLYDEDAVGAAAVLNAFADAGIEPGRHRWLADAQSIARIELAKWKRARAKGRKPLFLEVSFVPPGRTEIEVHSGSARPSAAPPLLSVRINLGLLFESVSESESAVREAKK
jgi:DNA-binding transcriptional MerR regulator